MSLPESPINPLRLPIGIHEGIPAREYHADPGEEPTLSASIASLLLRATPKHAWLEHPRLNPDFEAEEEVKFSRGTVAHELILGRGGGFVVVNADDWRGKAAKEQRDDAFARGLTPILEHQAGDAYSIATAVWAAMSEIPETAHMISAGTLRPELARQTERVMIWRDQSGPLCRSMLDLSDLENGRIFDVKTTDASLNDESLVRLIDNMGHDLSAGFYIRGLSTLRPELEARLRWIWIFVEAREPFEVRFVEASGEMLAIGDRKAALAMVKWQRCVETGLWPGYPRKITRISPAGWAVNNAMIREGDDPDAMEMLPLRLNAPPGDLHELLPPV